MNKEIEEMFDKIYGVVPKQTAQERQEVLNHLMTKITREAKLGDEFVKEFNEALISFDNFVKEHANKIMREMKKGDVKVYLYNDMGALTGTSGLLFVRNNIPFDNFIVWMS